MSTPATFGHMNEAGMELMAEPELHSCPLCESTSFKHIEWCDSKGEYLDDDCSCPGREDEVTDALAE